jgi:hypothetical protein
MASSGGGGGGAVVWMHAGRLVMGWEFGIENLFDDGKK